MPGKQSPTLTLLREHHSFAAAGGGISPWRSWTSLRRACPFPKRGAASPASAFGRRDGLPSVCRALLPMQAAFYLRGELASPLGEETWWGQAWSVTSLLGNKKDASVSIRLPPLSLSVTLENGNHLPVCLEQQTLSVQRCEILRKAAGTEALQK